MSYQYGDSTEAGLSTNFLELLRDALDFSVCVLQADESIKAGHANAETLRRDTDAELARLEAFGSVVAGAIDGAEKGETGSPTAMCALQVSELLAGAQRATADAVRAKLAADLAAIDAQEAATRTGCYEALAAFLAPHGPADAAATQRIALIEGGTYHATLAGRASFGLDWVFDLNVPEGNLWSQPVKLERIAEHVEIKAPQVAGWITKEVKVRPQRIERHTVTELTTDGARTFMKLRVEASVETGFDMELERGPALTVKMTRIGPVDDASVGPFEVDPADVATVVAIVDKLTEAASELEIGALGGAMDPSGVAFRELAVFAPVVERLVERLTPVVREIAKRSHPPTELVLRRALADDRREEIFVTKSTLREKYRELPEPLRAMFAPLGLEDDSPRSGSSPSITTAARSELGQSKPPPGPPPKNEAFVEAVKKIMLVLKSGRTDEGYTQYADLLSSTSFAEYRPDEQRQALKLLLLAKAPEGRGDAVMRAYKIALSRIQTLVDTHAEPADYEMLGVAHVQLEDRVAASAAFEIALKLERARNPSSELCASLGRRLAQLS